MIVKHRPVEFVAKGFGYRKEGEFVRLLVPNRPGETRVRADEEGLHFHPERSSAHKAALKALGLLD